jgi:restriction system protein
MSNVWCVRALSNERQLVDLLVEHWNDIPQEFRELLGLRPGLVMA